MPYRTQYSYTVKPSTKRTKAITNDEVLDLVINLNTTRDVLEFIAKY